MPPINHIALFFNSGIGNSFTLTPLINGLKAHYPQAEVTGVFFDNYGLKDLYSQYALLDHCISPRQMKRYDVIYIDWFSLTKKTALLASTVGKEIIYHQKRGLFMTLPSKKQAISIPLEQHMGAVNFALLGSKKALSIDDFYFPGVVSGQKQGIVLQVGCGDGKTPYKQWPQAHWLELTNHILNEHPTLPITLLGDRYDQEHFPFPAHPNLNNLMGKINLAESAQYIQEAQLFIGQDSGLMHAAVALQTPTLTIWGGSDYRLYGYQNLCPSHHVVSQTQECWPCNSWLSPNSSRVTNPLDCPDQRCIKQISVSQVYRIFADLV